jgi:hypothetical protein
LSVEVDDTTLAYALSLEKGYARVVVGMRDTPRWAAASQRLHPKPLGEQIRVAVFGANLHAQVVGFAPPGFEESVPSVHHPVLAAGSGDTLWMAKIDPSSKMITVFLMDDKLKTLATTALAPPADVIAELIGGEPPFNFKRPGSSWGDGVSIVEAGPGRLLLLLEYFNFHSSEGLCSKIIAHAMPLGSEKGSWKAEIRDFPLLFESEEDAKARIAPAALLDSRVHGIGLYRRGGGALSLLHAQDKVQGVAGRGPRSSVNALDLSSQPIVRASKAILVEPIRFDGPVAEKGTTSAAIYCANLPEATKEPLP